MAWRWRDVRVVVLVEATRMHAVMAPRVPTPTPTPRPRGAPSLPHAENERRAPSAELLSVNVSVSPASVVRLLFCHNSLPPSFILTSSCSRSISPRPAAHSEHAPRPPRPLSPPSPPEQRACPRAWWRVTVRFHRAIFSRRVNIGERETRLFPSQVHHSAENTLSGQTRRRIERNEALCG